MTKSLRIRPLPPQLATPAVTMAAAHPPPLAQPPPLATAQPPPPSPDRHLYQGYPEEGPYFRPPHRQQDRRPPRCFFMWRRGTLCVTLPGSLSPPTLAAPTSARQRSRPSQRTGLGTASHRRWRPKLPSCPFKLLEGSPEAKVTPVGCAVGTPITGQLTLEGIPVLGLVTTGASVTCMGFSVWWRYRAQWGPLKPFGGVVHGAHGKPLQIPGKTQHLDLQWGEVCGRAYFIVIIGLESPPCLIGMDIMRPLRIRIDVTNGTATPAQPDPQTIHLNAAQQQ